MSSDYATVKTVSKRTSSKKSGHKGLIAFLVIVGLVVTGVAWYNSDFWPWPSDERIRERLEEVIDICTNNEDSIRCKNIQKRYNMTFRYCESTFPTTKTYWINGQALTGPSFDEYAVAWEGDSSTPPKSNSYFTLDQYRNCKEHRE